MDTKRRKELLLQWKNRRPEMGIISIRCKATGEIFADISKDTAVAFNSHRFQLSANLHRNNRLQELWKQYGEDGFIYSVEKVLKYENPDDDQTEKLTAMLESFLSEHPQARRLYEKHLHTSD